MEDLEERWARNYLFIVVAIISMQLKSQLLWKLSRRIYE